VTEQSDEPTDRKQNTIKAKKIENPVHETGSSIKIITMMNNTLNVVTSGNY
jgi:hypothetical protein